ncbi:MAG: hypothetical protein IKM51_05820 [Oscillospiraceae bacterium]|nr:hypothetical protein [Oscillospiraceae bacterium]
MDIPGLAGNEKIKDWVRKAAFSRTLPHAVLITGDEGSGKRALAAYLAAAYVCSSERPACLECRHCKKAAQGLHPDITVLDPAGKLVPVEEIRRIRSDAYIRPNEAERKVYIIIGAERMNINGTNALLKVLEEPPGSVAFILTSSAPDLLPHTLRSRCERLALEPAERSAENSETAQKVWKMIQQGAEADLASFAVANEKMSREDMCRLFDELRALAVKTAAKSLTASPARCIDLAGKFEQARQWCESNIGAGHLLAWMAAVCSSGQ